MTGHVVEVPGRDDVAAAAARIEAGIRRTPVIEPGRDFFDAAAPDAVLKLELLQHTGSFKPRGALHRALTSEIPATGLIAASGGNHGLAVAWVARRLAVPAEIFVPERHWPKKQALIVRLSREAGCTSAFMTGREPAGIFSLPL